MNDADDRLLATALDELQVVEDYVGSLLALTRGDLHRTAGGRRFERLRRALHVQERSVVMGFASGYSAEQLRKSSIAADDLASAVVAVESAGSEQMRTIGRELRQLGLVDLPGVLADPQLSLQSPALTAAFESLHSAIGVIRRAQTARTLERMRAGRAEKPSD
jgi:hypothetical protein